MIKAGWKIKLAMLALLAVATLGIWVARLMLGDGLQSWCLATIRNAGGDN